MIYIIFYQRIFVTFRERKLSNTHQIDPHQDSSKDRRHSHGLDTGKNHQHSPTQELHSQWYDGTHNSVQEIKSTKRTKSIDEIRREYDQVGCQFYQIYHPSTKQNLQIDANSNSIIVSNDSSNFSSKLTHVFCNKLMVFNYIKVYVC